MAVWQCGGVRSATLPHCHTPLGPVGGHAMNNSLGRAFGISGLEEGFRVQRLFWARGWPGWLTALAILAALGWIAYFYRRDGSRPPALAKAGMSVLRLAAMVLLLLLCFQPRLLSQRIDTTQSIVAVLIDVSKSMTIH